MLMFKSTHEKEVGELKYRIKNLEVSLESSKSLINKLNSRVIRYYDISVDFEKMRVVCIGKNNNQTEIGYLDQENILTAWLLDTTDKEHQQLVEEFKEYLKNKNE